MTKFPVCFILLYYFVSYLINKRRPIVTLPPIQTTAPVKKFRQAPEPTFTREDIYQASFLEKAEILKRKSSVILHHSQGIPIALVENKTNFIQTVKKMLLYITVMRFKLSILCPHLFQTIQQ